MKLWLVPLLLTSLVILLFNAHESTAQLVEDPDVSPSLVSICDSNPCPAGATCVASVTSFLCVCPPEFLDEVCVQSRCQGGLLGRFCSLPASASAVSFLEWQQRSGKSYSTAAEELRRFLIFQQNLLLIQQKNAMAGKTIFGTTIFADLTYQEFQANFLMNVTGILPPSPTPTDPEPRFSPQANPDDFDWRNRGVVTGCVFVSSSFYFFRFPCVHLSSNSL
jgi:hypothetical protein